MPKIRLDCKKVNLLSDRARKPRLGGKVSGVRKKKHTHCNLNAAVLYNNSPFLPAKPSNFDLACHLAVVSTPIFLVNANFGKRLFTPAIPARIRPSARKALQWSLSPNSNAPQKTPVMGIK